MVCLCVEKCSIILECTIACIRAIKVYQQSILEKLYKSLIVLLFQMD